MDDREKLIELQKEVLMSLPFPWCTVWRDIATKIADYLIANGVTVQRWRPASEPPKARGVYQVAIYDKEMQQDKVRYGQFIPPEHWFVYNIYGEGVRCDVTHWMPMPEPPKEEK